MSATIDWDDPTRNMYGCTPCPMCRKDFRFGTRRNGANIVACDDCGFTEPIACCQRCGAISSDTHTQECDEAECVDERDRAHNVCDRCGMLSDCWHSDECDEWAARDDAARGHVGGEE